MQPKGGVMSAVRPASTAEHLPAPQVDQRLAGQTDDASMPQGKHINHCMLIFVVYHSEWHLMQLARQLPLHAIISFGFAVQQPVAHSYASTCQP